MKLNNRFCSAIPLVGIPIAVATLERDLHCDGAKSRVGLFEERHPSKTVQ
jgi:hypothetical protein